MGSTVTTGKKVCAIRDEKTGEPYYLLFEQTYEKNCYPHTPDWSCCCVGDIRKALKTIFAHAAACEGGMLQSRSGHITPEGYIQGWMAELKNPSSYTDGTFHLKVGLSWTEAMTPDQIATARAGLVGNDDALAFLDALERDGEIAYSLHENIRVVADILDAAMKPAWSFDFDYRGSREIDCGLGYSPEKTVGFQVVVPEFLRINNDERIMKGEDGLWRRAGWAYSVVGNFVSDLWAAEMKEPGSYKKRIKAFREACAGAALVSFPVRVRIDSSDALSLSQYQAKDFKGLLDAIDPVANDPGAYVVTEEHAELARWTAQQMLVWEPEQQAAT